MPEDEFDATSPLQSRWDQQGAEFVQSNKEWVARCCSRLLTLKPQLRAEAAMDLAQEWSLQDALRALSPELVAEDALRPMR
jgi:hypothetical protein